MPAAFTPIGTIPLRGPGGEPVDLWRTILSHGVASLPPHRVDEERRTFTAALRDGTGTVRVVRVTGEEPAHASVAIVGASADSDAAAVLPPVAHLLRLDADLSGFYASLANDPDLAWAAAGAGRMMRSATLFEDVVKTVCTTNCTWSATERMVGALVAHLGEPAELVDDDADVPTRAFPTAATMAEAPESFYREVAKAGYRSAYLRSLATSVAEGTLDLDALLDPDLPTVDVEKRLLALPGVGPYAAAHILTLIGRYDRLILDSWTRPTYRRLTGLETCDDAAIVERFSPYGEHAGLAFWLYLTRRWVEEPTDDAADPAG